LTKESTNHHSQIIRLINQAAQTVSLTVNNFSQNTVLMPILFNLNLIRHHQNQIWLGKFKFIFQHYKTQVQIITQQKVCYISMTRFHTSS